MLIRRKKTLVEKRESKLLIVCKVFLYLVQAAKVLKEIFHR